MTSVILRGLLLQKRYLFVLISALLFLSLSQTLLMILLGPLIKALFSAGTVTTDVFELSSLLSDRILTLVPWASTVRVRRSLLVLWIPLTLILGIGVKAFAGYVYHTSLAKVVLNTVAYVRSKLFEALLSLPYKELSKRSAAEWMSCLMSDLLYLQIRFSDLMQGILRDVFVVLGGWLALAWIHFPTACILGICAPLISYWAGLIGKKISHYAFQLQNRLAAMSDQTLSLRKRFDFIFAQDGTTYEKKRTERINQEYFSLVRESLFVRASFAPFVESIGFILFGAMLWIVNEGYFGKEFSPINILVFFVALAATFKPLRNLGEQTSKLQETRGALKNCIEILNLAAQYQQSTHPQEVGEMESVTHCRDISCGFVRDHPVTRLKDLRLKQGTTIALIGASGAGKSTFIKTLSGLIEPLEWQASQSWNRIRHHAAFVSQSPFLFRGTVYENLIYGLKEPPAVDSPQIEKVLRLACVKTDVEQLPEGLNTPIRAIGSNLSGGQIQRLVIARALLQKKPLLILDEATSALAPQMEELLLKGLIQESKVQKWILIASTHKLEVLNWFDEVWVAENGQITVSG